MLGKNINGTITYATDVYTDDEVIVINPTEKFLKEKGYKEIIFPDTSECTYDYKIVFDYENDSNIYMMILPYNTLEEELLPMKVQRQEENKSALKQFLKDNPIKWIDGNFYGVTEEDQTEMIADKTAYDLKQQLGFTDWKLEWHDVHSACREFTTEEFVSLLNSIIDFVYPYRRLQETYKEQIFACTSEYALNNLVFEYTVPSVESDV